ncbi:hypothetical protein E1H12_14875 [Geitlerinema sp. P-1104]|nr:hypothetical protein [Geitlerinema sp. P-1104]
MVGNREQGTGNREQGTGGRRRGVPLWSPFRGRGVPLWSPFRGRGVPQVARPLPAVNDFWLRFLI